MATVVLRRPNGRMQACDPCRSRKVACDHQQPICRRCIGRGQEDECVYTSSIPRKPLSLKPLSSGAAAGAATYTTTSRDSSLHVEVSTPSTAGLGPSRRPGSAEGYRSLRRAEFRRQANTPVHDARKVTSPLGPSHDAAYSFESPVDHDGRRRNQSVSHEHASTTTTTTTPRGHLLSDRASTPAKDQEPGYLGYISHSSVLRETENSLSMIQGFQAFLPQLANNDLRQNVEELRSHFSPTKEMCLVVLRGLPAPNVGHIEANKDSPLYRDSWLRLVGMRVLSDLHERFGSYLGLCRVDSQLEEIALFLSENTAKPFQEDEPDSEKWIGQFTGPNLRWESIGLIFSFIYFLPEDHNAVDYDAGGKQWSQISRVCLGLCIDLSRRFASANSLLAQLYMRRSTKESIYTGDASYSSWGTGAESVALATFLGLHAESNSPSYEPSLASESRRLLFAQMFVGEKHAVLFTGRPPRLSHRYAFTPLPLDLRDEDLLRGGDAIKEAVRNLDKNGWNTSGKVYAATFTRARYILSLLRDELIEIGIGKATQKVAIALLRDVKERQIEAVKEFPSGLDYNPSDLAHPDANITVLFARILLQLEQLQNLFLIERLLSKHGEVNKSSLLPVSYRLVELTLLFWTHKDRFASFRNDFEWLVMAFATPSGGILCMELLNSSFKGSHPKNPSITRSNIIQQLSLLIGFLEWIDPSRPNGSMCVTTSAVMRRVLDHVLNANSDNLGWQSDTIDDMQLDFNFELFDTFDWMKPDVLT
ncbi:N-terminal binuclear Zn cluster-containing/DNA binding domain-containing protein [Trichoderma austrokoningii]